MIGIDLSRPVLYKTSSLRFFDPGERHISRYCEDDVLLLVFDGVLRFSENDVEYEVHPGNYHIQKKNCVQRGDIASDSPKYFYVHFQAEWSQGEATLPFQGTFDIEQFQPIMQELDRLSHNNSIFVEQSARFYGILSMLYQKERKQTLANRIADFLSLEYKNTITLETICDKFHFSKNHIINIFKEEYGVTPFAYINDLKIERAEYLLEVTSASIENIALESGFHNYSHFYRLFLRKNGLSPAEWRAKKRISP